MRFLLASLSFVLFLGLASCGNNNCPTGGYNTTNPSCPGYAGGGAYQYQQGGYQQQPYGYGGGYQQQPYGYGGQQQYGGYGYQYPYGQCQPGNPYCYPGR